MARRGKGFAGVLFETGTKLVSTALEGMMKDPRGQEAVARAVGIAQRGKRRVEELQGRVMEAAGIPGRQDYQDLAKQLARIKRKARELGDKVDAARRNDSGDAPDEGPGEGGSTHRSR